MLTYQDFLPHSGLLRLRAPLRHAQHLNTRDLSDIALTGALAATGEACECPRPSLTSLEMSEAAQKKGRLEKAGPFRYLEVEGVAHDQAIFISAVSVGRAVRGITPLE